MEASPLIKAHDHAREASIATRTSNTVVAVNEHALAAGEFATAAHKTSSAEALRTLRLLEKHHQRLSQLLRYTLEHPLADVSGVDHAQTLASDSISEKDDTNNDGDAKTATNNGAGAAKSTTSISGVVSRGEFAKRTSDSQGEGYAVGDGAAEGASGRASHQTASAAAESMSATAKAHKAGVAAMASLQSGAGRRYPPARELSSSIANNLASARGIRGSSAAARLHHRGQPAAPSISNDQAPGSLETSPGRKEGGGSRAQMQSVLQQQAKPSWVPPTPQPSQIPTHMFLGTETDDGEAKPKSDEGFSRFYNRFGSIINRLSAPLAFAGLPLITEEPPISQTGDAAVATEPSRNIKQRQPVHHRSASQLSASAAADPDLSQIYSRAALRAVGREPGNGNDSFYVVPKTGHTASYANILSFDQKEKRRQVAASIHGGHVVGDTRDGGMGMDRIPELADDPDDDFVDANEHPSFAAAGGPSRVGRDENQMHQLSGKSGTASDHLVEELYTENQGLKGMLDKLSRRLHTFEASAQQSHMALQESMRFMRPGSPTNSSGGAGGTRSSTSSLTPAAAATASLKANTGAGSQHADSDDIATDAHSRALLRKTKDLEEELARALQRLDASERERTHQEKTLQKYREKWEKLRAGAKARRDANAGPSET
ncbi:hypothetical protein SEPCBS57363_005333 [Sporothrix epigloea]|uniref:Uncharacterized protein n=1 Tax=Sporothrix epigloea TaxID=1892477 RepID=A0ABP0DWX9_9PEZI